MYLNCLKGSNKIFATCMGYTELMLARGRCGSRVSFAVAGWYSRTPLVYCKYYCGLYFTLQWRHDRLDGVSNHQPHDCFSTAYSDQRKHQSSASLALVRGIHRGPVNSPHKWLVTRKMFPFDDVIMTTFEVLGLLIVPWTLVYCKCTAVVCVLLHLQPWVYSLSLRDEDLILKFYLSKAL